MVKNTIGGKKGKMLSKKQHSAVDSNFPVSTCPQEIYVCVTKVFGGGVFEVTDQHNHIYKAFLRGKMKGSNKRHNIVSLSSILLVGIRADFSDKSSVDILFVYDISHIQVLSMSSLFPRSILAISNHNNNISIKHNSDIIFSDTDHLLHNNTHSFIDNDDQHTPLDNDQELDFINI
jgi:hypothetical protein